MSVSDLPVPARLLFGPGPSPVSPRVMQALAQPVIGHLDPTMGAALDDVRARLGRLFRAPDRSLALAVPGTGTSGVETAVATLVAPGTRVVSVVTGYFGDRLAQICARYGGAVRRVDVEWGRACDPEDVRRALADGGADVVTVVHAETSTGVLNPVADIARAARDAGALALVDAVTSLGAHPVDADAWQLGVCSSCTQKGIGAPPGLAPIMLAPAALERRVPARSFYLDIGLLEDYWVRRKYHHTLSSSLVLALREALREIEDETLERRWARHERHHRALVAGLEAIGLDLLPPERERLWVIHAVKVPTGVDEAAVRHELLDRFNIEIGGGLGPLAGRIWRIGLMGSGSTPQSIVLLLAALEHVLSAGGWAFNPGAGTTAVVDALAEKPARMVGGS
jgi:alanine-glyoxylate transaminase/serine-glyoxylate transaminase/serine-pyruvate transaminase